MVAQYNVATQDSIVCAFPALPNKNPFLENCRIVNR